MFGEHGDCPSDVRLRRVGTTVIAPVQAPPFGEPDRTIAREALDLLDVSFQRRSLGVTRPRVPTVPVDRDEVGTKGGVAVELSVEVLVPGDSTRIGLGRRTTDLDGRVVEGGPQRNGCSDGNVRLGRVVGFIETEDVLIAARDEGRHRVGDCLRGLLTGLTPDHGYELTADRGRTTGFVRGLHPVIVPRDLEVRSGVTGRIGDPAIRDTAGSTRRRSATL